MRRLSLFCLLWPALASAQVPDSTHLSSTRADRLTGLYLFDDGTPFHVLDLRDQMNGRPVLSLTEYGSGRIRALYPQADRSFNAGSGWFTREPAQYTLTFNEGAGPATGLQWSENGITRRARRAPLVERDVVIPNGDIRLAGTLVLPPGPGPHPVVVMIPGSGPLTRRTLRYTGDLIALRGVAVLSTDKRGTGGSSGQWNGLAHRTWATDVEAQLDFLRAQPGIDTSNIGLFAGSEGGFVAPPVAARRSDVRFLACRVCSALPHAPVIVHEQRGIMQRQGFTADEINRGAELLERLTRYATERTGYDSLVAYANSGTGTKWRSVLPMQAIPPRDGRYWDSYGGVLDTDPAESYRKLRIPVLAILGERDDRILVDGHRSVLTQLARDGHDVSTWVVPGATHGLQIGGDHLSYPPGMHERIARWIVRAATRDTTSTVGPGAISGASAYRGSFTPDGDTLYYFRRTGEGEQYRIFRSHRMRSGWSTPERFNFGGDYSDAYPTITPDGQRIVFSSYRPAPGDTSSVRSAYLWMSERREGAWGPPRLLTPTSTFGRYHAQPQIEHDGSLSFVQRGADYRGKAVLSAPRTDTGFGRADTSRVWRQLERSMPAGYSLYDATLAPDGLYAVLAVGRVGTPGAVPGPADLWIAWRDGDMWADARPLRAGVNTGGFENFPFWSPGGDELYFVRDFTSVHRVRVGAAVRTKQD